MLFSLGRYSFIDFNSIKTDVEMSLMPIQHSEAEE